MSLPWILNINGAESVMRRRGLHLFYAGAELETLEKLERP